MRAFNQKRHAGFTLIEVLIATSVLSMVISALFFGIYAGTRAWSRANEALASRVMGEVAMDSFVRDLEFLSPQVPGEDLLPLFTTDESGRGTFSGIVAPRSWGVGASQGLDLFIIWSVEADEEGRLSWVRRAYELINGTPGELVREETVVADIRKLAFDFAPSGALADSPESGRAVPKLVRIHLELDSGATFVAIGSPWGGGRPVVDS